jgi:hypothetical protein
MKPAFVETFWPILARCLHRTKLDLSPVTKCNIVTLEKKTVAHQNLSHALLTTASH